MTHETPDAALLARMINRRRFLSLLGGAGAVGAIGCSSAGGAGRAAATSQTASAASGAAADETLPVPPSAAEPERRRPADPNRRLVVIELSGGNDGLAMLQPYGSGLLQDARPELVRDDEELVDAGSGFGWHPALTGMAGMGIAGAVGIGSLEPDFSHFEMEQRWWRGNSEDNGRSATGFFGRLCDQLDAGDPVTGLSFAGGPAPALQAEKAVTVGLGNPGASWFFQQDDAWFDMLRSSYGTLAEPSVGDSPRFAAARDNLDNTLRFADSIGDIRESDEDVYPWSDLGQQLRFAAEVIDLDVGVRVMHVQMGGFDTHTGQQWRHSELMQELNDATVAFVDDLKQRDRFDDTLIVTTSEFGRRVPANDAGTDHGGASTMLLCGPTTTGIHGEAPDLTKLDDGNVTATARFEDYYATIAEDWFGIDADEVLENGGTAITGLI